MSESKSRRISRQSKNVNERHNSGIPGRDYRYKDIRFREVGGSKAMNVNGSATSVDFFIQPPADELWIIDYLTLLLIDPGDMIVGNFASLVAPLSNGLEVLERINTVENVYTNLTDNADLVQCFFGGIPSGLGPGVGSDPGFLNQVDKAMGRMVFDQSVILDGADNDRLTGRVNDDLLLVSFMAMSAHIRLER